MGTGIRITPSPATLAAVGIDSASNRPWIVRDLSRPFAEGPRVCRYCTAEAKLASGWRAQDVLHDCKTYHFALDEQGTVMVSTTIWQRLQGLYDHGGFEKVNEVAKPPSQGLLVPTAKVSLTPVEM